MYAFFLIVCFGASSIGAICGIGGGVIIKPVLDAFGVLSVSAISFLSGCTVLAMSAYSVVKSKFSKESFLAVKTGLPLALGAAAGGICGRRWNAKLRDTTVDKLFIILMILIVLISIYNFSKF